MPTPADAARLLTDHGLDYDSATRADIITASELAGLGYPDRAQQDLIRTAINPDPDRDSR